MDKAKYIIRCLNCKNEWTYQGKNDVVKAMLDNQESCGCPYCERYSLNVTTDTLTEQTKVSNGKKLKLKIGRKIKAGDMLCYTYHYDFRDKTESIIIQLVVKEIQISEGGYKSIKVRNTAKSSRGPAKTCSICIDSDGNEYIERLDEYGELIRVYPKD